VTPTVLVDDERVDMTSEARSPNPRALPWLIQGGMGVAISGWPLARAVAHAGQLGVVSGTALDTVFVRRLQDNGIDEPLQDVLDRFPVQSIVSEVRQRYAESVRSTSAPYRVPLMLSHRGVLSSQDLLVLAAYVEVALAKSGHDGLVGINLLTKVQLPTAATLYGAMLAGVDYVMMGAGVPTHVPGLLDRLSRREAIDEHLTVVDTCAPSEPTLLRFDPARYDGPDVLSRPKFLAIVSSHVLATVLARRSSGTVDGFVIERPSAGGHNAPPRGAFTLDKDGSPRYGPRDEVDFAVVRELGLPFWIGGGVTSPRDVHAALELGATGVQVGTLFAYCRESGMEAHLRAGVIAEAQRHTIDVTTSMVASSTGYPFKVATVAGTLSDPRLYAARERTCDLGYLREAYARADGAVGYRCSAEPVANYLRKGGALEDTVGATCLCNGLLATCGLGQVRSDGRRELPIVTSGDHLNEIRVVANGRAGYGALDVINYLGSGHLARVSPTSALAH
jgi:NAD(P)H-dependent flavin oxidoreductase YrpB (nitropropane dioxygenase family)